MNSTVFMIVNAIYSGNNLGVSEEHIGSIFRVEF
jgi:hypothetical protein